LRTSGVECVAIPANSPNCNAHAERFVKTIRNECLDHMVLFGESHMRHVVREYVAHYISERYHQGAGSAIIRPGVRAANDNGTLTEIRCRSRLGGLLNYYHREAA
jgi:putative transposase